MRTDPIERALRELAQATQEEIRRHPAGHVLADRDGVVRLDLAVDLRGDPREKAVDDARASLRESVEHLIHHRSVLRPGRVWCLRCGSVDCEHAVIEDPRSVFTGWTSTGLPRFEDLGQWMLERRSERVEGLFRDPPELLAEVVSGRDLAADLLSPYLDDDRVRVHGQVVAGWYRIPEPDGAGSRSLATTLQIVSTPGRKARRRMAVHVVGAGLGAEEQEFLVRRLGHLPWSDSARWAQSVLFDVERSQRKPGVTGEWLSGRIEGILASIARRLEQTARSRSRRTEHAEERHRQGDRPTRTALADLRRAGEDDILRDRLRSTWIVLGGKSRAHVFADSGRLVTSLRSLPEATRRKRDSGRWQAVPPDRARSWRQAVLGDDEPAEA